MQPIDQSLRFASIEKKWRTPVRQLFYHWHWDENLKHAEIGGRVGLPRGTVTRWFRKLRIPSQSCTRFTNLNLWSFRTDERPKAKPRVARESPWKVNQAFFQKWSEEMVYVLGYIYADGALTINPRGSHYFEITSTDKEILDKIRTVLSSNHTISCYKSKVPNHKLRYRLQVGSKKMFADLTRHGLYPNKSITMNLPCVPKKFFCHFVRGYFDGDGCIYFRQHTVKARKNPKWIFATLFTSGSKEFLIGLQRYLQTWMKGGFMVEKQRAWQLTYSHNDSRALFDLIYGSMRGDLFLSRKYMLFKKAVSWTGGVAG